jgi:hypothetical protein
MSTPQQGITYEVRFFGTELGTTDQAPTRYLDGQTLLAADDIVASVKASRALKQYNNSARRRRVAKAKIARVYRVDRQLIDSIYARESNNE